MLFISTSTVHLSVITFQISEIWRSDRLAEVRGRFLQIPDVEFVPRRKRRCNMALTLGFSIPEITANQLLRSQSNGFDCSAREYFGLFVGFCVCGLYFCMWEVAPAVSNEKKGAT